MEKKEFAEILNAAKNGQAEALTRLVTMYHTGEGVQRSDAEAARWQEQLAGHLFRQWQAQPSKAAYHQYAAAVCTLADLYLAAEMPDQAMNVCSQCLRNAPTASPKNPWTLADIPFLSCLISVAKKANESAAVRENCCGADAGLEEMVTLMEIVVDLTKSEQDRRALGDAYYAWGDALREESLAHAQECYIKSHDLYRQLAAQSRSADNLRGLARSYKQRGGAVSYLKAPETSLNGFCTNLECMEQAEERSGTAAGIRLNGIRHFHMGEACLLWGDLPQAEAYFLRSAELFRQAIARLAVPKDAGQELTFIIARLTALYLEMDQPEAAKACCRGAAAFIEQQAPRIRTDECLFNMALSYCELAEAARDRDDLPQARACFIQALPLLHRIHADSLKDEVNEIWGVISFALWEITEAKESLSGKAPAEAD